MFPCYARTAQSSHSDFGSSGGGSSSSSSSGRVVVAVVAPPATVVVTIIIMSAYAMSYRASFAWCVCVYVCVLGGDRLPPPHSSVETSLGRGNYVPRRMHAWSGQEQILVSWCFKPRQPQRITSGLKETFMKRYVVERTNKAEIRPEEQSEKSESCRENLRRKYS